VSDGNDWDSEGKELQEKVECDKLILPNFQFDELCSIVALVAVGDRSTALCAVLQRFFWVEGEASASRLSGRPILLAARHSLALQGVFSMEGSG
jgi:hypothetical protein